MSSLQHCPHCGFEHEGPSAVCPNCGRNLPYLTPTPMPPRAKRIWVSPWWVVLAVLVAIAVVLVALAAG